MKPLGTWLQWKGRGHRECLSFPKAAQVNKCLVTVQTRNCILSGVCPFHEAMGTLCPLAEVSIYWMTSVGAWSNRSAPIWTTEQTPEWELWKHRCTHRGRVPLFPCLHIVSSTRTDHTPSPFHKPFLAGHYLAFQVYPSQIHISYFRLISKTLRAGRCFIDTATQPASIWNIDTI